MWLTWNLSAYLFRAVGAESVGLHINNLELKAVFQALQGFQSHILNKCFRLLQMNSKEVGTHSPSLCICMGAPMLVQSSEYNYSGSPNPRETKRSSGQPFASRSCPSNGMVSQSPNSSVIFDVWGTPQLDLFETRLNICLPLFVFPIPYHMLAQWMQCHGVEEPLRLCVSSILIHLVLSKI